MKITGQQVIAALQNINASALVRSAAPSVPVNCADSLARCSEQDRSMIHEAERLLISYTFNSEGKQNPRNVAYLLSNRVVISNCDTSNDANPAALMVETRRGPLRLICSGA